MRILILITFVFTTSTVYAHNGVVTTNNNSTPEVNRSQAALGAKKILGQLVVVGRMNKSWLDAEKSSAVKKEYKGNSEWVITYFNPSIKDAKKSTLYIYLNLYGKYLGSNYTGK